MTLSIHVPNDAVKTNDADQLKASKQLKLFGSFRFEEDAGHWIEGYSRKEINHETALEVLDGDCFLISDDFTVIAYDSRPENDNYIDQKEEVNYSVKGCVLLRAGELGLKRKFDR